MKRDKVESTNSKPATVNRKARYDYHLMERHEAGISLKGTEVKSIRNGGFTLTDSYVKMEAGEDFLSGFLEITHLWVLIINSPAFWLW